MGACYQKQRKATRLHSINRPPHHLSRQITIEWNYTMHLARNQMSIQFFGQQKSGKPYRDKEELPRRHSNATTTARWTPSNPFPQNMPKARAMHSLLTAWLPTPLPPSETPASFRALLRAVCASRYGTSSSLSDLACRRCQTGVAGSTTHTRGDAPVVLVSFRSKTRGSE